MPPKFKKLRTEVTFYSADKNGASDFETKTSLLIEDGRKLMVICNHKSELPFVKEEAEQAMEKPITLKLSASAD